MGSDDETTSLEGLERCITFMSHWNHFSEWCYLSLKSIKTDFTDCLSENTLHCNLENRISTTILKEPHFWQVKVDPIRPRIFIRSPGRVGGGGGSEVWMPKLKVTINRSKQNFA